MSKLTDRISYIYHHRPHPFDGLWRWAKGHLVRWQALRHWAARKGFQEQRAAYAKKVKWLKEHADPNPVASGSYLVTVDGHQVPRWIASILNDARKAGAWSGGVISGYRSPEYSTSLCMGICGSPQCPGRCAGASSNHSCPPTHTGVKYEGAVDVSDPAGLEAYCRAHDKPLYGNGYALSADLNHFSNSGR